MKFGHLLTLGPFSLRVIRFRILVELWYPSIQGLDTKSSGYSIGDLTLRTPLFGNVPLLYNDTGFAIFAH